MSSIPDMRTYVLNQFKTDFRFRHVQLPVFCTPEIERMLVTALVNPLPIKFAGFSSLGLRNMKIMNLFL